MKLPVPAFGASFEGGRVLLGRLALRYSRTIWLLPLFLLYAGGGEVVHQALPVDARVLAFGDSVTYGTGAGRGEDYPSRLRARTGWNVINAGIPGDTATRARDRLAPLLLKHAPDMVIIELGGNDFLRKQNVNTVIAALRSIIRQSQDAGAVTVLVAVPQFSLLGATIGSLNDSPIYAMLAEEEGALLVPGVFAAVLSEDALRADAIHPNAAGYRQFNNELIQLLLRWGLLL